MPCTTHASMHSAPLRKKGDALRSSARSGYLMRRLRHAVSRPCDAICAVLEPSAVLRLVRCGWCCSHTSGSATCLIADALSSLPRACGASALQLAAAGAPWAASLADAFRVRHRWPCAFPRGRSTGLSVAVGAIRSRRGRHRPRADPSATEAAREPDSDAHERHNASGPRWGLRNGAA